MARTKGTFKLGGTLEIEADAPADARLQVKTKADLTASGSFPYKYIGMIVSVESEQKAYMLIGSDPTVLSNWQEQGTGSGGTTSVELTQAQYDALPQSEKMNGTVYYITDGQGGGGSYTAGDGIIIDQNNEISTDNLQTGDMDDIVTPLPPVPVTADTLEALSDVNIDDTTLADGQALVYDATNQEWVNGQGSGGDSSLSSDVTSNLAVGAIASGTTLAEGTTFTEFVQKLLITEIAPTIGFSISKSGNVAQGTSYTETLTVSVSNMGTAKKIKTIEWYEGSTLKQTDTIDSTTTGSWTYTMGTATTSTTTFKAIVKYTKSNDVDDQQTKTASITFYFNKFYGGVSDLNPTEATVEALTSALATGKGGTYSFTVSAGRICYAYPKSLGALTSIKDGNGFSLFDSFTRTEQTYTQAGQSVVYYRYVLTDATTVSSYSVIFA